MMTIPAGRPAIELIKLARQADQPILFGGQRGVGKSSLFELAAQEEDIGLIVCDLSLMEPVDLVGIPSVNGGRTVYAPPAFLPTEGEGLICFEELNRCPRYMQVPCLQLLTARRLNQYSLPKGWLPCAAINMGDEYQVDELDPAILSRFLKVQLEPDVEEWCKWARGPGDIHQGVIEFVTQTPGVFADAESNPRAWAYASRLLRQWESLPGDQDQLAIALAGVLNERWAVAFLQFSDVGTAKPVLPAQVMEGYSKYRSVVRRWLQAGRLDLVVATADLLKHHLQRQGDYDAATSNPLTRANIQSFFSDLPGDLKRSIRIWLKDRGFNGLKVPRKATP